MKIVDANIILRYLLNDHDELSAKATTIIEDNDVLLPNEVVAFVDTLLYAYHKVNGHQVFTFDKKLNKLLEE